MSKTFRIFVVFIMLIGICTAYDYYRSCDLSSLNVSNVGAIKASKDGKYFFISDRSNNKIHVYSISSNSIIKSIPVGAYPGNMDINYENTRLYVANNGINYMSIVDLNTFSGLTNINVNAALGDIVGGRTGRIYSVENDQWCKMYVIDTNTNTILSTITGSYSFYHPKMAITNDFNTIALFERGTSISRFILIDASTDNLTIKAQKDIQAYGSGMVIKGNGSMFFPYISNTIYMLSNSSGLPIVSSISIPLGQIQCLLCSDTRELLFAGSDSKKIYIYETETGEKYCEYSVPDVPLAMAISRDESCICVFANKQLYIYQIPGYLSGREYTFECSDDNKTKLILPAGSFSSMFKLTVSKIPVVSISTDKNGKKPIVAYEFSAKDMTSNPLHTINNYGSITLHCNSSDLGSNGVSNLKLCYWDGVYWVPVTSETPVVSGNDITISGRTSHMSIFGIMGVLENNSSNVKVGPNPFTPYSSNTSFNSVVFTFDNAALAKAELGIWNLLGNQVRLVSGSSGTINWDGKDDNGVIQPSGIYIYQLKLDSKLLLKGTVVLAR